MTSVSTGDAKRLRARAKYRRVLAGTEERWRERFGPRALADLRTSLEIFAVSAEGGTPPLLFEGLEPHADGWRASVRPAATLPHCPMVLHRGGYPDGS